jgi:hypothetical protein
MSSLVQLHEEEKALLYEIEQNLGEVPPEFEALQEEISKKVDATGFAMNEYEKEIEALEDQGRSIAAAIKTKKTGYKNWKAYLSFAARKFGQTSKTGAKFLKGNVVKFTDITKKKRFVEFEDKVPDEHKLVWLRMPMEDYKRLLVYDAALSFWLKEVEVSESSINAADTCPDGCIEKTVYNVRVDGIKKAEVKPSYEAINE